MERSVAINMQEFSRLILGLRAAGWTDTQITDFILYIGGDNSGLPPFEKKPDK